MIMSVHSAAKLMFKNTVQICTLQGTSHNMRDKQRSLRKLLLNSGLRDGRELEGKDEGEGRGPVVSREIIPKETVCVKVLG